VKSVRLLAGHGADGFRPSDCVPFLFEAEAAARALAQLTFLRRIEVPGGCQRAG